MESVAFTMATKADVEEMVEKQISDFVSRRLFMHVKFCHYATDMGFGDMICQGVMKNLNIEGRPLDWRAVWWKTYEKTVHDKIAARRGNASKGVLRNYMREYLSVFVFVNSYMLLE